MEENSNAIIRAKYIKYSFLHCATAFPPSFPGGLSNMAASVWKLFCIHTFIMCYVYGLLFVVCQFDERKMLLGNNACVNIGKK
jgi:hypothetical protein